MVSYVASHMPASGGQDAEYLYMLCMFLMTLTQADITMPLDMYIRMFRDAGACSCTSLTA